MSYKDPKKEKEKKQKYDEKRAGARTRNWAVIFYPEDLPENWQEKVDELMCRWIEGPLHDQDVNPDGTPKKAHVHTLFMFDAVKNHAQVADMLKRAFGESESGSIIGVADPQQATDRSAVVRYMAHLDHPNKVQYDVADIKGHNGADPAEVLRYSATETIQMMIDMEEYIEEHGIMELADFSKAIRYDRPEWYTILATKQTRYFSDFIRSCRHKSENRRFNGALAEVETSVNIDPETGEVLEDSDQ